MKQEGEDEREHPPPLPGPARRRRERQGAEPEACTPAGSPTRSRPARQGPGGTAMNGRVALLRDGRVVPTRGHPGAAAAGRLTAARTSLGREGP